MRIIAGLVCGRLRSRVAAAHCMSRRQHTIAHCETWRAIRELASSGAPADCFLVDPFLEGGSEIAELARLPEDLPNVPIIAYADPRGVSIHALAALNSIPIVAVITAGVDDQPAEILAALDRVPGHTATQTVIQALREALPPTVAKIGVLAIEKYAPPLNPERLSGLAGVRRRTMERSLREHGLPSPESLIQWGRIINAARLLQDSGRSGECVAFAVGYSSGAALSASLYRYLGLRVGELRSPDSLRSVSDTFLRQANLSSAG